ncbi:MAG: LPS export ABC transporter permease LptF [gamma proteobacterium symbiont of Bathyaustriella thionipta]|nr:LPS export ABC transporter permease LptF [gamma proteobacterium symbiont of Bathyaustriella thionipta]MCU7949686.1 LPS export ABC transporter permease LptF [gamma proteobacterium symbiont of Bathyaustriella thionipta]MCU7952054.1 LPS export ABC transporter permease LptF [gamma proteobacterium symbiont of Bathyaustriella thionipta]MCU7956280.1 LPS export ABC transporter permease LptF [gamma proteobacterium symbiont of Bathyaustriella thionipta]MCU7968626.1 LPS export ABC transporter permease 
MIVRDYIIKEVLRTFIGVFVVLFLIILSTQFLKALSAVADGKIALDFLFSLILLKNIESLTLIIPLTFFLSILLALSRLYKDSEMIAFSACGIGPDSLLKSIIILIFSFVFLEIGLSMILAPWASNKLQHAEELFKSQADLELITAGQFNLANNGKRVLFTEKMPEPTELKNVFLHVDNGDSSSVMASDDAKIVIDSKQGARYIVFQDGNRYDGSLDYRFIKFKDYGVLMKGKQLKRYIRDRESLPTIELWASNKLPYIAELQWRISQVLMMVLLAIIAVPLSKTAPRQGRYGKMALAILLYIAYSNLLVVAMNWIRKGVISPIMGMWWVHALFLLLFFILFVRQMGWLSSLKRKSNNVLHCPDEFDELVDN